MKVLSNIVTRRRFNYSTISLILLLGTQQQESTSPSPIKAKGSPWGYDISPSTNVTRQAPQNPSRQ